jgi:uncharacterized protein (DUF849 family)
MADRRKVIISCALTGGIHTPTMSPALPVNAARLGDQGIAAAKAGAAILHVHARNERDGSPAADPAAYLAYLPRIKAESDVVINVTTGGGLNMTVDERLRAPAALRPEMCSLNMGSINFGIFPLADRYSSWKHPWEEPYLRATEDFVFKNTFKDIARILSVLGEHGTRFEHECYDVGHLYNLAYFVDKKAVRPPFLIQMIFGVLGGIAPEIANLLFMKQTADRLFGSDYIFSVLAAGRHQMPFATQSVLLGGSVRVGLEDSLYIGPGKLATSNAEQVTKVRTIVETLDH